MEFILPFKIDEYSNPIEHSDKIYLAGSCFAENIFSKLDYFKFNARLNAHGIMYNPISIARSLKRICRKELYTKEELIQHDGLFHSFDHHSSFSGANQHSVLENINSELLSSHNYFKELDLCILSLGSAIAWRHLEKDLLVANNHKIPLKHFEEVKFSALEMTTVLSEAMKLLRALNPNIRFILTLSPVRHIRYGLIKNNRSKARLMEAIEALCFSEKDVFYFPAYELVMDVLRDYRFYKEDLVHPNQLAINFVWQKFRAACLSSEDERLMNSIDDIQKRRQHRGRNPNSAAHKLHLDKLAQDIQAVEQQYDYIKF